MLKAIVNGQIISDNQLFSQHAVVFDHRIRHLCPQEQLHSLPVEDVIDAQGLMVCPGLIETHIHGIAGADIMDSTPAAVTQLSQVLARQGVTAFLPTTMTAPWHRIANALAAARQAMRDQDVPGARVLGAHLEGPFLSQEFCGAQAPADLMPPDTDLVLANSDVIRLVTYAPELDADHSFAGSLLQAGIIASIGHTAADYHTVERVLTAGVRHVTHLFNAMPPLHHRKPGPVAAILACGATCEIIADNLHLHPDIYRMLLQTIGLHRIILVSDSMRATTLGDGLYELGGQRVQVQGNAARLPDGKLAGSVCTLNQCVRNFQRATGLDWPSAWLPATGNPARLLGLQGRKGSLQPGNDADIVLFDDNANAQLTIVHGMTVHDAR